MKVTKLTAPMTFETMELPDPALPQDGIVIQVAACGLTDHDVKAYFGEAACESGVLGGQVAGTVVAVGENASGYAEGDRVLFSRYVSCGSCAHCRGGNPQRCGSRTELGDQLMGGLAEFVAVDGHML